MGETTRALLTIIAAFLTFTLAIATLPGCTSREEVIQVFKVQLDDDYPNKEITEVECRYDEDDAEWDCTARIGVDKVRTAYECKRDITFDYYCEPD